MTIAAKGDTWTYSNGGAVGKEADLVSLIGGSAGGSLDSAGNTVYPDNYAQVLTYNGDSTVNTIAFTDGTNTWTKTFTYTAGNVTGISKWVKS